MTSTAILAALQADPTERGLSDLAEHADLTVTWLPDRLGHLAVIGYACLPAADGLLRIPYTRVARGDGWEHLDLDAADLVPEPPDYANRARHFREAQRALTQCVAAMDVPPFLTTTFPRVLRLGGHLTNGSWILADDMETFTVDRSALDMGALRSLQPGALVVATCTLRQWIGTDGILRAVKTLSDGRPWTPRAE